MDDWREMYDLMIGGWVMEGLNLRKPENWRTAHFSKRSTMYGVFSLSRELHENCRELPENTMV